MMTRSRILILSFAVALTACGATTTAPSEQTHDTLSVGLRVLAYEPDAATWHPATIRAIDAQGIDITFLDGRERQHLSKEEVARTPDGPLVVRVDDIVLVEQRIGTWVRGTVFRVVGDNADIVLADRSINRMKRTALARPLSEPDRTADAANAVVIEGPPELTAPPPPLNTRDTPD